MEISSTAHAVDALSPGMKSAVIDGEAQEFINADTVIALAQNGETPEQRHLWDAYQQQLSIECVAPAGRKSEAIRAAAMAHALKTTGHRLARSPFLKFW